MPINNSDFVQIINLAYDQLRQFSEEETGQIPAPNKWSKKQIIGHLIDSASNNHQRFVRAQQTADLQLPSYAQMDWVKLQNYQTESWEPLLMLWKCYNQHLAHVIANISEEKLENTIRIGDHEPVTLGFLIEDYVRHLQQHLRQIFG